MNLERLDADRYRISDGTRDVEFDRERYEDLFYAGGTNTTALYRLLVDNVCTTRPDREAMAAMINATGDMEAVLDGLQQQIQAMGAPA